MGRLQCSVLLFCFSIVTDAPYLYGACGVVEKHYLGLSCMKLV